jgi:8-oxo-dGTP pyrophosphatase MutT (NUDIX family)
MVAHHTIFELGGYRVSVKTLSHANEKLNRFRPRKKWYRRFVRRSAVAVILRERQHGIEALMIKRAERKGDPWSGHMAFPGGRAEVQDISTLHTARRETWEEIGLDTEQHTQYRGRLSDIVTRSHRGRRAMVVTPYVFTIDDVPELAINHEVAEVLWVPLTFLTDANNRQRMQWQVKKVQLDLPCYFYQERRIWGLSLRMLDELLVLVYQAEF